MRACLVSSSCPSSAACISSCSSLTSFSMVCRSSLSSMAFSLFLVALNTLLKSGYLSNSQGHHEGSGLATKPTSWIPHLVPKSSLLKVLCLRLGPAFWWAEIARLTRITWLACARSKLSSWRQEPPGFAFQCETQQIDDAIQVEYTGIHYEIIQVWISRVFVVLYLQITGTIPIFNLYTCPGCVLIQPFTLHDVDDTLIERCHNTYMEHIAPLSQEYLGASTDNHDLPGSDRSLDNPAACFIIVMRVCG